MSSTTYLLLLSLPPPLVCRHVHQPTHCPTVVHGTLFYENVGATLAFIAFFTAMARSFDVMTDPLMAWVRGRCESSRVKQVSVTNV
jgi:hypothetical protein